MRVLVVAPGPEFSVQDVYAGLVAGLRAQPDVEVAELCLNERLTFYSAAHVEREGQYVKAFSRDDAVMMAAKGIETACYEMWPDVVIVVSGMFIPPAIWGILARRPHHKVLWCTESPYEDDRQIRPARYADTVILNDPRNVDQFRTVNKRTWYFPQSFDPAKHYPGVSDPDLECDFAFVGTGFPERIEFFEKVDWSGIDAKFAGNWLSVEDDSPLLPLLAHPKAECIDNVDAARLYRSAKVTANLYRRSISEGGTANGWAIGPREVELAACRSFFLRDPRVEGDMLFPGLPKFTTPTEFGDQLRWWLDHPVEREAAAAEACAAIQDRTFEATAARLLELIDGAPTTVR